MDSCTSMFISQSIIDVQLFARFLYLMGNALLSVQSVDKSTVFILLVHITLYRVNCVWYCFNNDHILAANVLVAYNR